MLYSFKSRFPAREGSGVIMCPTAPDPASLLWRALALSCALPLQILPLCLGGLRRCHVSCGMGPHLSAREGFDVAMCVEALDPASLLRRALVLLCVSWLWTLPPYLRGLRRCHMPRGFRTYLLVREGSDTATCHTALSRPRISGIKKSLAGLVMQLGSCVSKARP
jgi:hypothetical protein